MFIVNTKTQKHFIDAENLTQAVELLPAGTQVVSVVTVTCDQLEKMPVASDYAENMLELFEFSWYATDNGDGPEIPTIVHTEVL